MYVGKMASGQKTVDAAKLVAAFRVVTNAEGLVLIDEYVLGYNELARIFERLGKAFMFVHSDVVEKVDILKHHRQTTGDPYASVQSMIKYEVDNELTDKKTSPLSGSRTLLRLHRAMAFIAELLAKLDTLGDIEGSSTVAREAYHATLAPYHTWIVRKLASLAIATLPTHKELEEWVFTPSSTLRQDLMELVQLLRAIHQIVEDLYSQNSLHNLP